MSLIGQAQRQRSLDRALEPRAIAGQAEKPAQGLDGGARKRGQKRLGLVDVGPMASQSLSEGESIPGAGGRQRGFA